MKKDLALGGGHMIYLGGGFRDRTIKKLHSTRAKPKKQTVLRRVALLRKSELGKKGINPKAFPDIELLTWENSMEVLRFVKEIEKSRRKFKPSEDPKDEARDLSHLSFQSPSSSTFRQSFTTVPWTCEGEDLFLPFSGDSMSRRSSLLSLPFVFGPTQQRHSRRFSKAVDDLVNAVVPAGVRPLRSQRVRRRAANPVSGRAAHDPNMVPAIRSGNEV